MVEAYLFKSRARKILALFLSGIIFLQIPVLFAAPVQTYEELLTAIHVVQQENSAPIKSDMKQAELREAWGVGKLINEHLLPHLGNRVYGGQIYKRLDKDLNIRVGELYRKAQFARIYPEAPVTINLSWSHYREIMSINDPANRAEIARQAEIGKWSTRQLLKEISEHKFKTIESEKAVIDGKLTELKAGKPGLYKMVKVNGELKAELGFDVYRDAPNEGLVELEENQIVSGLGSYFGVNPDAKHEDLYTYNAVVLSVVDGDTLHAAIDLGFNTTITKRLRLRRVDAPELNEAYGEQAKAALDDILRRGAGNILLKVTHGNDQDNYGRYLVDVFVNGKNIDQELVDTQLFTVRGGR